MHLVEMRGIVLAGMSAAVHRERPEGTGLVVAVRGLDRVGTRLVEVRLEMWGEIARVELLEGIGLRGMWEGPDLQPITRGLRGILMRDFRREAIGHRRNHGHRDRHNRGHRDRRNHGHRDRRSSDLSRGRRRRVRDRVVLAGITMPEQRGRRAIAGEPVLAVVVGSGEVDPNETSQS
jgi:hypothetical protein